MANRLFTLKDWEKLKKDIFDDFFNQHNLEAQDKDMMKINLMGNDGSVPPGFHLMPGTNQLMADSEMPEGV